MTSHGAHTADPVTSHGAIRPTTSVWNVGDGSCSDLYLLSRHSSDSPRAKAGIPSTNLVTLFWDHRAELFLNSFLHSLNFLCSYNRARLPLNLCSPIEVEIQLHTYSSPDLCDRRLDRAPGRFYQGLRRVFRIGVLTKNESCQLNIIQYT